MPTRRRVAWRTSTRNASQGACVEVGRAPDLVGIRDTKDRDGGTLAWDRMSSARSSLRSRLVV
ncbi:DUF397 domain-containing protein [Actinoalloteichus hoggarensis]|uniref:DUF397 domain-containing protein n=1 Tax=Actinoalloteichus hoggarensis TaxID=1470176 RepID=UPI000B8AB2B5|nr:DUF397 domain-containing protein [Actinoalloteichus hoggarensis]